MKIDLQKLRDWADLILKIVSVIGIVAGGTWAYYQFRITDMTAGNIQLMVSTEVLPYSDESRLLVIHVKPKNIGRVPVEPGKDGLLVTVREIPTSQKSSEIALDKLPEVHRTNILQRFPDGYELEPGVEYDEIAALVVPKRKLYAVKASMDLGGNTDVDHTAIAQVE